MVSRGNPFLGVNITSRDLAYQRMMHRKRSDAPRREVSSEPMGRHTLSRKCNHGPLRAVKRHINFTEGFNEAREQREITDSMKFLFPRALRLIAIISMVRECLGVKDTMKLWFGCSGVSWVQDAARVGGGDTGRKYFQKSLALL